MGCFYRGFLCSL